MLATSLKNEDMSIQTHLGNGDVNAGLRQSPTVRKDGMCRSIPGQDAGTVSSRGTVFNEDEMEEFESVGSEEETMECIEIEVDLTMMQESGKDLGRDSETEYRSDESTVSEEDHQRETSLRAETLDVAFNAMETVEGRKGVWPPTHLSKDANPKMPTNLSGIFDELDKGYPRFLRKEKHCSLDYLNEQKALLKKELEEATTDLEKKRLTKKIQDKEWAINNREVTALIMQRLDEHRLVYALRHEHRVGFFALFWMRKGVLMETDVTHEFIRKFLMPTAVDGGYYKQKQWKKICHYDVRKNVLETTFKTVEKLPRGRYRFRDHKGQTVDLSTHFAKELVTQETLEDCAKNKNTDTPVGSFVKIVDDGPPPVKPDTPRVNFRNTGGLCAEASLASAMSVFGLVDQAEKLIGFYAKGDRKGSKNEQLFALERIVRYGLGLRKSHRVVMFQSRCKYNPLIQEHRKQSPVLAELRAKRLNRSEKMEEVGINHCVCFLGDFVFCANRKWALPICKESLDDICDSIKDGARYAGIKWNKELFLVPKLIKQEEEN